MPYDLGPKIGMDGEAEFRKQISSITTNLKTLGSEMKVVTTAFIGQENSEKALTAQNQVLGKTVTELSSKLDLQKKMLAESAAAFGETDERTQKWQRAVNETQAELNKAEAEIRKNNETLKDHGKTAEETGDKFSGMGEKVGGAAKAMGSAMAAVGKAAAAGLAAASAAIGALAKQSLEGYAEYEQLVGGVETLFGAGGKSLQEYAADQGKTVAEVESTYRQLETAQAEVLKNANDAYKTAGLSANDYMETVTSFSAALIASLDGDTAKAAQVADVAITDMADNANKMGTSMESIQFAYQGFAKQNYTMLDNLKLGYGGTKSEMERLLKDAEQLPSAMGRKFDISNYADVVEAIHLVQENMGIAGATAQEASTTIEGSANAMKAAWSNLITGMADEDADMDQLITNLVDSVVTLGQNILPVLEQALSGMGEAIKQLAPVIAEELPGLVEDVVPALLDAATALIDGLVDGLMEALPVLVPVALDAVNTLATSLIEKAPELLDSAITIITTLADGLTEQLPELIPVAIDAILQLAETLTDPDSLGKMVDSAIGLIMALADGLIEGLPRLVEQAPVIIQNLVMGIANNLPKIIQAGIDLIVKLAAGLIQAIPQLVQSIPQIISAIVNGFATYASKIMDIGKNIVSGIWEGITGMAGWIKEKVTGFFGGIVDSVKSFLGIHSPSTLFRDQIGYNMGLGVAQGLDKSSNKATKAADALAKNVYTASKDWLDKNTKYLQLSLQDQVDVWETIQSQFVKGSQQYADAEEQIFDLRQQIQKEHDDAVISSAQKAVKLQGTTTAEQLAIWEDAQKRVLAGSEQYQKAEEQVYSLREKVMTEFEASAKEIFATAETIQKEYDDALAKRTESIYGIYGLFNKAAEAEKVSAKELIKNLDSQVESLGSFYAGLDQLAERSFVPDDLIEEIRAMGPKVAGQLDALLNMDDDQLQTYTDLYAKKHELAAAQAEKELASLKDETDQKVTEQMQALEQLFDSNAPDIGKSLVDGLAQGIRDHNSTVINAAVEMAKATIAAAKDTLGIHSPSTVFASIGGNMALGLAQGWEEDFAKVRREIQSGLNFDAGAVSANLTVPGLTASNAQPDFADLMAGMVNGVQTAVTGAGSNLPQSATIVLQTPEGMTVARWLLPDLRAAMRDDPSDAM